EKLIAQFNAQTAAGGQAASSTAGSQTESSAVVAAEPGSELYKSSLESVLSSLTQTRRCLHYLIRNPTDLNLLQELLQHTDKMAGPSAAAGFNAVNEMVVSLQALLSDLASQPEQISASTLRTVSKSFDFIAMLLD